jgi:6-pyruvoyltetrahydropterin/6-carboxytetrahydropterin synthase
MAIIRISKEFTFEMAHALLGYDDVCRNIHGHSYTLVVTVTGTPLNDPQSPKNGMLIDFKELKRLIKSSVIDHLDHALLINKDTSEEITSVLMKNFDKVVLTGFQPTTENLLADMAGKIKKALPPRIALHSLLLRETANSYAEWYASDNDRTDIS